MQSSFDKMSTHGAFLAIRSECLHGRAESSINKEGNATAEASHHQSGEAQPPDQLAREKDRFSLCPSCAIRTERIRDRRV